ncbi:MAG: NUDIX hydrolase [Propionibacteriaceae bacterium]|jgi:ADP-ribose pyrophosphatase|nr:NUDIX hydrolase [Propionibacteriaceae bacterium]
MSVDKPEHWPILEHAVSAQGAIAGFSSDVVLSPSGERLRRQYLTHPGSVAVIALDEQRRVAVIDQYRHAIAMRMIEPPAGLLDVAEERSLEAAKRELAEEVGLAATTWNVLADFYSSPGISQETSRIYLARGLSEVGRPNGFVVEGEEAHMGLHWVPLAELLVGIRSGTYQNPAVIIGCLSLQVALTSPEGMDGLRPADAPWPARANKRHQDEVLASLVSPGD